MFICYLSFKSRSTQYGSIIVSVTFIFDHFWIFILLNSRLLVDYWVFLSSSGVRGFQTHFVTITIFLFKGIVSQWCRPFHWVEFIRGRQSCLLPDLLTYWWVLVFLILFKEFSWLSNPCQDIIVTALTIHSHWYIISIISWISCLRWAVIKFVKEAEDIWIFFLEFSSQFRKLISSWFLFS